MEPGRKGDPTRAAVNTDRLPPFDPVHKVGDELVQEAASMPGTALIDLVIVVLPVGPGISRHFRRTGRSRNSNQGYLISSKSPASRCHRTWPSPGRRRGSR